MWYVYSCQMTWKWPQELTGRWITPIRQQQQKVFWIVGNSSAASIKISPHACYKDTGGTENKAYRNNDVRAVISGPSLRAQWHLNKVAQQRLNKSWCQGSQGKCRKWGKVPYAVLQRLWSLSRQWFVSSKFHSGYFEVWIMEWLRWHW